MFPLSSLPFPCAFFDASFLLSSTAGFVRLSSISASSLCHVTMRFDQFTVPLAYLLFCNGLHRDIHSNHPRRIYVRTVGDSKHVKGYQKRLYAETSSACRSYTRRVSHQLPRSSSQVSLDWVVAPLCFLNTPHANNKFGLRMFGWVCLHSVLVRVFGTVIVPWRTCRRSRPINRRTTWCCADQSLETRYVPNPRYPCVQQRLNRPWSSTCLPSDEAGPAPYGAAPGQTVCGKYI